MFLKEGHSNQTGEYLTAVLSCTSLIISGGQGEFLILSHAMVIGVIFTWLTLGEECDDIVALSRSVLYNSFPPPGL